MRAGDYMKLFTKFAVATALIGGILAVGPAEQAQARDEGLYFALRGFGGYSDPGDLGTTGVGTLSERNTADLSAGGGGAFGYRLDDDMPLRFELEVLHRVRVDVDLRDTANNIGYENNLSSTTAMVGLGYEFRMDGWTPFLAAYAGMASNNSAVDRTNLANGTLTSTDNAQTNFAAAFGGGIDYELTQVLDLSAAYRFFYLGGFDTGTLAGGDSIDGDPFTSHDLVLSIQFNF